MHIHTQKQIYALNLDTFISLQCYTLQRSPHVITTTTPHNDHHHHHHHHHTTLQVKSVEFTTAPCQENDKILDWDQSVPTSFHLYKYADPFKPFPTLRVLVALILYEVSYPTIKVSLSCSLRSARRTGPKDTRSPPPCGPRNR
jgi:hypothetical protein